MKKNERERERERDREREITFLCVENEIENNILCVKKL